MDSAQDLADRLATTVALVSANPYLQGAEPTPKQWAFLSERRREVFYGGAAGGGKSWALMAAALMYVQMPGYSALLLRKNHPQLAQPGGLIPMSMEWLSGTDAKWSEVKKTWFFPSGATISFGHLETEKDKYRYQGGEYSFIGFDELTQIPDTSYTYLLSRLRQTQEMSDNGVPLRVRSAANPGGEFHAWVKDRFIDVRHPDRYFIPSTFKENPHLDRDEYAKTLAELDPVTRAQLESGDWDITLQGNMFNPQDIEIVDKPLPASARRCRAWDLATGTDKSDWTVGALLAYDGETLLVEHVWRQKADPAMMEKMMAALAQRDGKHVPILIEQERGSAGILYLKHLKRDVLPRPLVVVAQTPTGHKVDRAMLPSAMSSQGALKLLKAGWNREFLSELSQFPGGAHDDQVDVLGYAAAHLTAGKWPSGAKREPREKGLQDDSKKRNVLPVVKKNRYSVMTPKYIKPII